MWEFAHGEDQRDVQVARRAKSVSNETTFEEDTTDLAVLREKIEALARRVAERLHRRHLAGRTVVLKLTYRNFQHVSRRTTLGASTSAERVIAGEPSSSWPAATPARDRCGSSAWACPASTPAPPTRHPSSGSSL